MIEKQLSTTPRTIPCTRLCQRQLRQLVLCAAAGAVMLGALSGCVGIVFGGAVMGTVAASDRRTFGAQTEDKAIALKGDVKLSNLVGDAGHVNINSFNRKVLLTGEVRDEAMKTAVQRAAAAIDGVQSVSNELDIAGPSSYTSRTNDILITTKVKASLVDMKDISANSFKVVTERGIVYLMGRVTEREGRIASDVTRGVSGVQKVVKMFEYISEGEAQQISQKPAASSSTASEPR